MANSPSPSSPPLKTKKDSELAESSEVGKSLFILCRRGGGIFLHEIIIGENGFVKGKPFADLLLITKMFNGEKDVSWAISTCANLGSKLYLTAASLTNRKIFKTQLFDAKDRSLILEAFNANPLIEKSSRPLARRPNYTLLGACGKIYALVLPPILSEFASKLYRGCSDPILFECFDPIAGTWESLSPPPTSLDTFTGYVVIEEHHLILVSFVSSDNYDVEFYSFNLLTLEWNQVLLMDSKDKKDTPGVEYGIHHPHFLYTGRLYELGAYPIYGKAEFVGGVIYGCVLRTIATYRFSLDSVTGQVLLEASILHHQALYNCNLIDFEDAPAYKDAPFGLPSFNLMEITHLGNNLFCVVETAVENGYEYFSFQPVYITTFYLNVTQEFNSIEMVDSTIRLVDVSKFRGPSAAVMLCFSPLDLPLGYNQHHAGLSTDSLCQNFKEYVHSRIPTFCKVFLNHMFKLHPYANMLFSKMKHEIEKSEDPIVRYFFQYMLFVLDRGPRPDPLLLVADKKLDKGLMVQSPRPFDLVESLDCNKSIFIVSCVRGGDMCGLHELRILKGAVDGNFIPLKIEVKQYDRGGYFESVNLGNDVYFFSIKRLDAEVAAIVNFSVVNVEKNSRIEKLTKSAPKNNLMAFGNGLKIYALSSPSKFSDSIPMPAFECFDPASGLWEPLKPAPFHSVSMVAELCGYAIVDDFVVISLNSDEFEFYSYNFNRNEWLRVLKPENMERDRYVAFNGKSEYVDGKIYTYGCDGVVIEFSLTEYQDGFLIYPPVELNRLDIASLQIDWDREFSEFLIHLGSKVFCAIDTGESTQSYTCQFARVTTFTILNSGDVQTWHSTVCVLDTEILDWDWTYILQCFTL